MDARTSEAQLLSGQWMLPQWLLRFLPFLLFRELRLLEMLPQVFPGNIGPWLFSKKFQKKINSYVIPNSLEDLGRFLAIRPGTFWNLISHLHQNPLLRNLISNLHQNPPEPHQPSAPEPSQTSSAICTRTLRNLTSNLPRNPPEPH